MNRRAVTLVEALLITSVSLGLMAVAYGMLKKSSAQMDNTDKLIGLQVGVRNLLENMVRDVGACHQILQPQGDPEKSLVLVKYASDEVQPRLDKNPDKAFPFVSSMADTTKQKMDLVRVTYTWDPAKHTVNRKEEPGELVSESESSSAFTLTRFTFTPSKVDPGRDLAASVETLALTYVGYDPQTGQFRKVGAGGLPFEKTACVAVRINAQYDEGLYAVQSGPNGRTMPKIEIFTKIWSMKRRSDETYKEYFSSTDEDLRW